MGSTPIFQISPLGHTKPWMSSLPKASGGLSRASRASMEIVFLPLTIVKSTVGVLSPPLAPLLFRLCSDLAEAERRRDGREKAHAFTSASHAHKEKKSNCSDMHTCAYERTLAHDARSRTPRLMAKRGNNENMWKKTEIPEYSHVGKNAHPVQLPSKCGTECECKFENHLYSNHTCY